MKHFERMKEVYIPDIDSLSHLTLNNGRKISEHDAFCKKLPTGLANTNLLTKLFLSSWLHGSSDPHSTAILNRWNFHWNRKQFPYLRCHEQRKEEKVDDGKVNGKFCKFSSIKFTRKMINSFIQQIPLILHNAAAVELDRRKE